MFKLTMYKPLIALAITAAVAGCGGGSSGGVAAPPPPDIPASALASVDGLIAFLNQLIDTATNETSEPLVLGDVILPVDDIA